MRPREARVANRVLAVQDRTIAIVAEIVQSACAHKELRRDADVLAAARAGDRKYKGIDASFASASARGGLLAAVGGAGLALAAAVTFASLYLLPTKKNALPSEVRLAPAW